MLRLPLVLTAVPICIVCGSILAGCMKAEPRSAITSRCSTPPASPIGVTAMQNALRRQGIATSPDPSLCRAGATYIVTTLTMQTDETSVFCSVEKRPSPRTIHQRHTIYEGAAPGGKARELLLSNVDCRVYGDDTVVAAVRHAMRQVGGSASDSL